MARHVKISAVGCADTVTGGADADLPRRVVDYLDRQLEQVTPQRPDLIVLPERCDVPYDVAHGPDREQRLPEYLDASRGPVMDLMSETAKAHRCYIAYPTYIREGGDLLNAVVLVGRDGQVVGRYAKHRPMVMELDDGFVPGPGAVVLETDFGTIGFAICFDLNFEELRKQYEQLRPDLLAFCSVYHGGLMQSIWAYACRAHMVAAIAPEAVPSEVRLPTGEVAASSSNYLNHVTTTINLDSELIHLDCLFDRLDAIRKAYGPALRIHDPGRLGSVLLSAEADDLTMRQVIDRFELEGLDDYLERSRRACAGRTAAGV